MYHNKGFQILKKSFKTDTLICQRHLNLTKSSKIQIPLAEPQKMKKTAIVKLREMYQGCIKTRTYRHFSDVFWFYRMLENLNTFNRKDGDEHADDCNSIKHRRKVSSPEQMCLIRQRDLNFTKSKIQIPLPEPQKMKRTATEKLKEISGSNQDKSYFLFLGYILFLHNVWKSKCL